MNGIDRLVWRCLSGVGRLWVMLLMGSTWAASDFDQARKVYFLSASFSSSFRFLPWILTPAH
jgi:hypothetical protein